MGKLNVDLSVLQRQLLEAEGKLLKEREVDGTQANADFDRMLSLMRELNRAIAGLQKEV
jgi:hypothetical protein